MILLESHSYRQLHGLCMNPVNYDEYATVGDDGIVRVWSLSQRRCVRRCTIEVAGRCVAWSPDGTHIAIGIGGDPTMNTKDGALMVLASSSMDIIFEDRKAKFTIADLKYSPSGALLVVVSRDGKVYLHDCTSSNLAQQYKLLSVVPLELKDAYVTHIDFNTTSTILKLSTSTCELLHYDLGEHPFNHTQPIPLAAAVKDETWATNHVPYGWLVKGPYSLPPAPRPHSLPSSLGVWKSPNENVEVSALDTTLFSAATRRGLIAASYGDGEVKIFNYPCQNIGVRPPSLLLSSSSSTSPHPV
jgi:WD40 repeat protein